MFHRNITIFFKNIVYKYNSLTINYQSYKYNLSLEITNLVLKLYWDIKVEVFKYRSAINVSKAIF